MSDNSYFMINGATKKLEIRGVHEKLTLFIVFLFLSFNSLAFATETEKHRDSEDIDIFNISGTILDSHREPVKEAEIRVFVNENRIK